MSGVEKTISPCPSISNLEAYAYGQLHLAIVSLFVYTCPQFYVWKKFVDSVDGMIGNCMKNVAQPTIGSIRCSLQMPGSEYNMALRCFM
jgi:hypothetical protein